MRANIDSEPRASSAAASSKTAHNIRPRNRRQGVQAFAACTPKSKACTPKSPSTSRRFFPCRPLPSFLRNDARSAAHDLRARKPLQRCVQAFARRCGGGRLWRKPPPRHEARKRGRSRPVVDVLPGLDVVEGVDHPVEALPEGVVVDGLRRGRDSVLRGSVPFRHSLSRE